ncbi:MAG: hypothetical protein RSF73_09160 [Ruthenibacterium sp.]
MNKSITLTSDMLLSPGGIGILTAARSAFDYSSGTKGAANGYKYTVARLPDLEKIDVHIPTNTEPPMTNDAIEAHNTAGDFVFCAFEALHGTARADFKNAGNMIISATATKVVILASAKGGADRA